LEKAVLLTINKTKNIIKIIYIGFLLAGCSYKTPTTVKKLDVKSEIKLVKNYGINKENLVAHKDNYFFVKREITGLSINKLDNNYNLLLKKTINMPIEPKKYLIKNNYLYILGYDEKKQKPLILKIELKNLNIVQTIYLGKKLSLIADFFVNNSIYTAINVFNKNTKEDIYIYKNSFLFSKIDSIKNEQANFIVPFEDKILVARTITYTSDDALIVLLDKTGKITTATRIDIGMDENINSIKIKNNQIIINIVSTDYMGAEIYYNLTLDKNLNVLSKKKNLEFKKLPIKFRT
jgi:hypothetical protein